MRRRLSTTNNEGAEGSLNLTPLLDVVFVILIMFIVVAPMLELEEIALAPGGGPNTEDLVFDPQKYPIVLHVKKDNSVLLNRQTVTLPALEASLKELHKIYPQTNPLLFHDANATFGTYQRVKNLIENAGFFQVDVVLAP